MKKIIISCFFVSVLASTPLLAQNMADLYENSILEKWQPLNREDILFNFRNVIIPHLTPQEKHILNNVTIEFPLRGYNNDVFDFYASSDATITMPILSLRFFGDIALAASWLEANRYNQATIFEYIGMLKYHTGNQFPGHRYPTPLEALQIPENARDDPKVLDRLVKQYTTAIVFILCHELGHIYYQHPGYLVPAEHAQKNEAEADRFAIEIMRRMGDAPGGMALWFMTAAYWERHRGDFEDDDQWENYLRREKTHPLSAHRLQALATAIEQGAHDFSVTQTDYEAGVARIRTLANDIATIGNVLEDNAIQQLVRIQGILTDVDMLEPRHSTIYQIEPSSKQYPNIPFSGVYDGEITSVANPDGVDIRILFERQGNRVYGRFSSAISYGSITGSVEGNTLSFDWQELDSYGQGKFHTINEGKEFTGTWGDENSDDNGGTWNGKRQ